jgi:hypothetical protein
MASIEATNTVLTQINFEFPNVTVGTATTGTYILTDTNGGTLAGGETITVGGAGFTSLNYTGYSVVLNGITNYIYSVPNLAGNEGFVNNYYLLSDVTLSGAGTAVINNGPVLCLLRGALIRAAEGDVPIEQLTVGNLVATPEGLRRVRFIGETRKPPIELRRQGRMPIRIEAGALGELGPQAPLHCTPSHAFLIKGCLVEAQALINGTTIRQLDSWEEETVTYYSIELEQHALVWANGLLSETYFASVRGKHFSRTSWSNYADYQALYGEGEVMQELPHPRIPFARQLPAEIRELAGVADPAAVDETAARYALT